MAQPIAASNVRLKRAYEPPERSDGTRILVDRLWPRGVSKAESKLDEWIKEIAPSAELRTWFGHDPRRWDEFRIAAEMRAGASYAHSLLALAEMDEAHSATEHQPGAVGKGDHDVVVAAEPGRS